MCEQEQFLITLYEGWMCCTFEKNICEHLMEDQFKWFMWFFTWWVFAEHCTRTSNLMYYKSPDSSYRLKCSLL